MNIKTKYIRRELSAVIEEAYRYFSVITITGPRQSGKTTLIRNLFPHLPYYSLENLDVRSFAEIEKVAYDTERKLLKDVYLFDVYEGKNLESGKKSYAVSFILQDETKTLNDKQIELIMNRIIGNLQQKLNAKLR